MVVNADGGHWEARGLKLVIFDVLTLNILIILWMIKDKFTFRIISWISSNKSRPDPQQSNTTCFLSYNVNTMPADVWGGGGGGGGGGGDAFADVWGGGGGGGGGDALAGRYLPK